MDAQPHKSLRAVSVLDPGIDRARTDVDKYSQTRDPELIVPLPGAQLTWFHLRPLSRRLLKNAIDIKPQPETRWYLSFSWAIESVENLTDFSSGRRYPIWTPRTPVPYQQSTVYICGEDECEAFDGSEIDEIGLVAYTRASLRHAGEGYYALPPSSVVAMERMANLLAGRLLTASTKSSADIASAVQKALDKSDEDTAATAMENRISNADEKRPTPTRAETSP